MKPALVSPCRQVTLPGAWIAAARIIPEPAHGHHSDAPAGDRHAGRETPRRFVRSAVVELTRALRGHRRTVGPYPPAPSKDPGTAVEGGTNEGER